MCQFAVYTGIKESNETDFLAILKALELNVQKEEVRNRSILVEADSTTALIWVKEKGECPWKLRFEWNKLSNLKASVREVKFQHKNREVNEIADGLVKEEAKEKKSWVQWASN